MAKEAKRKNEKKKHKLSINYEEDLENIPVQKSFFLCGIFLWLIYSLLGCDVIVFSFSFPYPNV